MKKIYVGNLPYQASESDLEAAFAGYGVVVSAILIKDRDTGRAKGFGFVEFENPDQAQAALAHDGQDFQGRPLKVSLARERSEGRSRGDGRF